MSKRKTDKTGAGQGSRKAAPRKARPAHGDSASPRRRKDERPREIVAAAFEEFADKGFAGTRLADVASRAGVSKGLPYLYFRTKEELFKAVIRTVVKPGFDRLIADLRTTEMSSEDFLRGPFRTFLQKFVRSRRALVLRLMIAEGHKHPELTAFYLEEVISHGVAALRLLIDRGVERGEFRKTPLSQFPHLFVAPALMAVLWRILFERHRKLDTDGLIATNIDLVLDAIRAPEGQGGEGRRP